jgi:hypothetical protein
MPGFYHPQAGNPFDMDTPTERASQDEGGAAEPERRDDLPDGRSETHTERMDRLFGDLLQELRVMQTGAQLTSGFLLTLPFQSRFPTLDGGQEATYLVLVALSLLTTVFVMSAVAVHQRLTGRHVKDQVVLAARRLIAAVLVTLGLLVIGIGFFVTDVVVGTVAAAIAAAVAALILVTLHVVVPRSLLARSHQR